VANIPAADDRAAVLRLTRALRQAGFDVTEDAGRGQAHVSVGAFEAEEGSEETVLPAHRAGPISRDWGEVS